MQIKLIFFSLLLLFISCNKLPDAVGENNEIIIITSNEDRELINIYLNDIIEKYINTPIEEKVYKTKFVKPGNFSNYKYYKNIIIASLTYPPDSTIDRLYNRFKNKYNDSNIFSLNNLYAKGQSLILIGAYDSIDFEKILNKNKKWIENEIDSNINLNIYNNYLKRELNEKLNTIIKDNYSIDIYIDEDYKIIKQNKNFLWIGKGYPYRWLMFSKVFPSEKNDYWSIYTNFLEDNTDGIFISNYYKKVFKNSDKLLLTGIYEHELSDTGGPFFVYVFESYINNEVILVSGFVNNPGKDKYPLLREMKVLVENIKRN